VPTEPIGHLIPGLVIASVTVLARGDAARSALRLPSLHHSLLFRMLHEKQGREQNTMDPDVAKELKSLKDRVQGVAHIYSRPRKTSLGSKSFQTWSEPRKIHGQAPRPHWLVRRPH
jgi:hypothetical protein